jgi:hypothetical protein
MAIDRRSTDLTASSTSRLLPEASKRGRVQTGKAETESG